MTPQERDIITQFVERAVRAGGEPIDPEADRLLADLLARHPEARYRIAQTAFVQEHALAEAQNRIRELEWQLQNQQAQPQSRGFLGGLFGGGAALQRPMTPPPAPLQAPNAAALQQAQGRPGFLGTAAMTAAGVVGGVLLGNAIASWMSGSHGSAQAASSPWGAPSPAPAAAGPWGAPPAKDDWAEGGPKDQVAGEPIDEQEARQGYDTADDVGYEPGNDSSYDSGFDSGSDEII